MLTRERRFKVINGSINTEVGAFDILDLLSRYFKDSELDEQFIIKRVK